MHVNKQAKTDDSTAQATLQKDAAWGVAAHGEPRWPATLAVIGALILYVTLPEKLLFPASKWILPVLEMALLIPLTFVSPQRLDAEGRIQRIMALALIGLINAANIISLAFLANALIYGGAKSGRPILLSSIEIWLTNVLVFALWYWELDRGGPGRRCLPPDRRREPDFLFPQMVNPSAAPGQWYPSFVDYLYVSFTNATAFSPTDTMPLTEWAKILMMLQSLASLLTVVLVTARAVNILG